LHAGFYRARENGWVRCGIHGHQGKNVGTKNFESCLKESKHLQRSGSDVDRIRNRIFAGALAIRTLQNYSVPAGSGRMTMMKISRRKLLSLLGMSSAILAGSAADAQKSETPQKKSSGEGKLVGVNPRGTPPAIRLIPMAPRLDTLKGRTVYLVDTGFNGSDALLKQIELWFNRNMPGVTMVFRRKAGPYPQDDPQLWAEIKAKGNAAIMALGH